jgi:hypothetical protein
MTFMTPSSYGEALDRLTILELKLEFIEDSKRKADVQQEYNDLWDLVKELVQKDQFHYNKLLEVNRIMWVIQDTLHEGKAHNKDQEYDLMKQLAVENQRRFRIKRTINETLGSKHREQKGYKGKCAFVLSHLGMGDHFFMNGAVRWLASHYDEVCVVVKEQYEKNLKALYSDEPAVSFYVIKDDSDISPKFGCPFERFKEVVSKYDFVGLCGYHRHSTPIENFPLSFYSDMNIPTDVIHTWSNIPSMGTESLDAIPHIFYHKKASNFEAQIPVDTEECLVINPSQNMYTEGHRWYSVAEAWVGRPILDYVSIMKSSQKLLMTDSSFFCMALMMGLQPELWSRDGRSYKNLKSDLIGHTV